MGLHRRILAIRLVDAPARHFLRSYGVRVARDDVPLWLPALGMALVAAVPWVIEGAVRLAYVGMHPSGEAKEWWTSGPVWAWLSVYSAFTVVLLVAPRILVRQFAHDVAPLLDAGLWEAGEAAARIKQYRARHARLFLRLRLALCAAVGVAAGTAVKIVDDNYNYGTHHSIHASAAWVASTAIAIAITTDDIILVLQFTLFTRYVTRRGRWKAITIFAPAQTPGIRELRDFAGTSAMFAGVALIFFAIPITWAVAYVAHHGTNLANLRLLSSMALGAAVISGLVTVGVTQWLIAQCVKSERDRILNELDAQIRSDVASIAGRLADPPAAPVSEELTKQVAVLTNDEVHKKVELFNQIAASPAIPNGITSAFTWSAPHLLAAAILLLGWVGGTLGL